MDNYLGDIMSKLETDSPQSIAVIRKDEVKNFFEELRTFLGEGITASYEKFDIYLTIVKEKSVKKKQCHGIKGIEFSENIQRYSNEICGIFVDILGKNCLFIFGPDKFY